MTPKSSGSHHSGLCLQEGLSPRVAAELNHVLHAVAGDGGAVLAVVLANVALEAHAPPLPLQLALDLGCVDSKNTLRIACNAVQHNTLVLQSECNVFRLDSAPKQRQHFCIMKVHRQHLPADQKSAQGVTLTAQQYCVQIIFTLGNVN